MSIFNRLFSSPSTSKAEFTGGEVVDKLRTILSQTKSNYPNLSWANTLAGLDDDRIMGYVNKHPEDKPIIFLSLFHDLVRIQTFIHAQQAVGSLDGYRAEKYLASRASILGLIKELLNKSPDSPGLAYEKVYESSSRNPGLTGISHEQVIRFYWKEFAHPLLKCPLDS